MNITTEERKMIELILKYTFLQNAIIGGILVGITCAIIGSFIVLKKMSFLGDGLAHISFGGVAAGILFNINPLISALIFSVLSGVGIQKLKEMKIYSDAAIGIFFSFGLALGVILVSLSTGYSIDLYSYLFGNILAISQLDLILTSGITLIALGTVFFLYKELFYITFDEETAQAHGLPVKSLNQILIVICALAIVTSMKIVGILLVSSFLIIPTTTALMLGVKSFKRTIFMSVVISVISVLMGIIFSYYLDIATGGAIVMTLVGMFVLSLGYKKILKNN
jgi:zinc transport system permease protein